MIELIGNLVDYVIERFEKLFDRVSSFFKAVFSKKRGMNASGMKLSSRGHTRRAQSGYVGNVRTGASHRQNASRLKYSPDQYYAQSFQRKTSLRTFAFLGIVLLLLLCLAIFTGMSVYAGLLSSRLSLSDTDLSEVLFSPAADGPQYVVLAADLDTSGRVKLSDGVDAIALARLDLSNNDVSIVWFPSNTRVTLSDGERHYLYEAASDSELVKEIEDLCELNVNHLVKIDADSLVDLIDSVGGLSIDLEQEVDDPNAGGDYLAQGTQLLQGQEVLTALRASNFEDPYASQASLRTQVLCALTRHYLGSGIISFLGKINAASYDFNTDIGLWEASSIATSLRSVSASGVKSAVMPGYESENDDKTYYVSSSAEWQNMLAAFVDGQDLDVQGSQELVDASSFTILVRNGTTTDGLASQVADELGYLGFVVEGVGTTDAAVYDETLVIYHDSEYLAAANTVVAALGCGRVVSDSGYMYYTFSTDVLLIVGSDYNTVV